VIRRHVVVHGLVQGVFFRETIRLGAERRGVRGSVRNRRDGTVEAVLEGDAAAVEAVVNLCREGPRGARVDRVDVLDEQPEALAEFVVR
jgi:acylphosphatase